MAKKREKWEKKEQKIECPREGGEEGVGESRVQNSPKAFGELDIYKAGQKNAYVGKFIIWSQVNP